MEINMGAQKRTEKHDGGSCGHRSFAGNQVGTTKHPNPASELFSVTGSNFLVQVNAPISIFKHPRLIFSKL
jgi:hypothetical protein